MVGSKIEIGEEVRRIIKEEIKIKWGKDSLNKVSERSSVSLCIKTKRLFYDVYYFRNEFECTPVL